MAYSTIADYYQKQGKTLDKYNSPERTALATSAGITSAYVGSAAQNNQIVSYLNKQASTAITPQSLTPVKPAIIPTSPSPTNTTGLVDANNAGLVPTLPEGWTYADGKFTQTAPKTDTSTTSGLADIFKQYLGTQPTPPSLADTYAQQEQNAGIQAKQQAVQNYTNEVNSLVAQGTAGRLQVEGRDAPMGAILGEQAAIDRGIAIRALPIQAQLAAAQGDLGLAQTHLDKMFQIQAQDSQSQYEYNSRLIDSVFNFASEQEQNRLEELKTQKANEFTAQRDAINYAQTLSSTAIANGQGALAGQIMALDPKSKMYSADVARLAGQIKPEQKLQYISGTDNQAAGTFNPATGKFTATGGGGAGGRDSSQYVASAEPSVTTIGKNKATLTQVFNDSKITAGNKTSIGNGLSLLSAAEDLAAANPGGKFAGLYPARGIVDFFLHNATKREQTVKNESLISALDLQTQFWASGAALSPEQTTLVQKMIPTRKDTHTAVRAKTNQLVNYMLSQTASRLITDGVTFVPEAVDLFETNDLLENASQEQLEQLKTEGLI